MADPGYVLFYECHNSKESLRLQSRLWQAGVRAQLRNEALARRFPRCATQVWVARDQLDKAMEIAASLQPSDPEAELPGWRCAGCREENPGQFQVCWNCSCER